MTSDWRPNKTIDLITECIVQVSPVYPTGNDVLLLPVAGVMPSCLHEDQY